MVELERRWVGTGLRPWSPAGGAGERRRSKTKTESSRGSHMDVNCYRVCFRPNTLTIQLPNGRWGRHLLDWHLAEIGDRIQRFTTIVCDHGLLPSEMWLHEPCRQRRPDSRVVLLPEAGNGSVYSPTPPQLQPHSPLIQHGKWRKCIGILHETGQFWHNSAKVNKRAFQMQMGHKNWHYNVSISSYRSSSILYIFYKKKIHAKRQNK